MKNHHMLNKLLNKIFEKFIKPKSFDENIARREFIFNILLLSFSSLTFIAFAITFFRFMYKDTVEQGTSPAVLAVPLIILIIMYVISRRAFTNKMVYGFLGLYLILGTYSLYAYGYILPHGVLIYALLIITTGILISSKASFAMLVIIILCLCSIAQLQISGYLKPDIYGIYDPMRHDDLVIYIFIFIVLFSVSFLYSRELESSLRSARNSEMLLRRERNSLEIKVRRRTRELEKMQIEKTSELYRFAEYGKLSSGLIHDLANPLTAVSLNLDVLKHSSDDAIMGEVRSGVEHIEQYVKSARSQLRKQSSVKLFDSKYEIEKIRSILKPQAINSRVTIKSTLCKDAPLYGDSAKFSQIIANLITNGIDSYGSTSNSGKREILIKSSVSKSGKILTISVRDYGAGISGANIGKIFKPFFTTKTNDHGTGIGLTITKDLIENSFGGNILVLPHKTGTEFVVTISLDSNQL